jgi:hypothetical protein
MLAALAAALLPVAAGGALALLPRSGRGLPGGIHIGALVLAIAAIVVVVLPPVVSAVGAWALVAVGCAALLPAVLERWHAGGRLWETEAAVAGLVAHQAVDGFEVGLAQKAETGFVWVALAVALHTVPLVAAVTSALARHRGRRAAALRMALLLAATAGGVALAEAGATALPGAATWIPAIVAGLLLHVLWHELEAARVVG